MIRHPLALVGMWLLTWPTSASAQEVQGWHWGHFENKDYEVAITKKALAATPTWKEDDDNPPLAARKAIRLADGLRAKLVKDNEDYKWGFVRAELVPTKIEGKWYWLITYQARFREGRRTGMDYYLPLAVLMDGTVVTPTIKPFKRY